MMKQIAGWAFLVLMMSSCASLLGPSPAKLTGKWVMSAVEGEARPIDRRRVGKLSLTFEEDGRLITDLPGTMEYMEGAYQLEKKMLTLIVDGDPADAIILSLKNGELWIQPLDQGAETPYTLKFTKS